MGNGAGGCHPPNAPLFLYFCCFTTFSIFRRQNLHFWSPKSKSLYDVFFHLMHNLLPNYSYFREFEFGSEHCLSTPSNHVFTDQHKGAAPKLMKKCSLGVFGHCSDPNSNSEHPSSEHNYPNSEQCSEPTLVGMAGSPRGSKNGQSPPEKSGRRLDPVFRSAPLTRNWLTTLTRGSGSVTPQRANRDHERQGRGQGRNQELQGRDQ